MRELLVLGGARAARGSFRLGPLDLSVAAGESVAIVGPNGAGKSTALAVAIGEIAASGTVRLGGDDPRRLPRSAVARRAALMRQGGPVAFGVSAIDIVLHGRYVHLAGLRFPGPRDVERARDGLRSVAAGDLATRAFSSLSGGERQRVLLAKALVQDSPLVLLDEPTAGLDLRARVALSELLVDLPGATDRGVLLVTHDLDLAAGCDRVLALLDGTSLAQGSPGDVLRPDLLERLFGQAVDVDTDPETGRPRVHARFGAKRHAS